MGSEKYPGENHFSDWLSKNWGSENACTVGRCRLTPV